MAIPRKEKNIKLDAAPQGQHVAAITAFLKLDIKANDSKIKGSKKVPELPNGGWFLHYQGVSVYVGSGNERNRVITSTSADKGKLVMGISQGDDDTDYKVETKPVGYKDLTKEKVHPGGIQVIGQYVVVPIFFKGFKCIEIRDIKDNLKMVHRFKIDRKPFCLGITTTGKGENERYVLAVVTHSKGMRVDVYRSDPGAKISDRKFEFKHFGTFKTNKKDINWDEYSNNISLLSDTDNNMYFVGMFNTNKKTGNGTDFADLHHMELIGSNTVKFTRLHRFLADPEGRDGSFRWGAGVTVLDSSSIQIYSCEKKGKDGGSFDSIECDLYIERKKRARDK